MLRYLTTIALVLAMATPAVAHQTEVDSQDVEIKREGRLRWERQQARLEAQEQAEEDATVSVAPSYGHGKLWAFQVADYARAAGFPEHIITTMVAIAWRESSFDPGAINPSSGACGLWQMYPCPGSHALNPSVNAAMAFAKYQAGGLAPWGY